MKTSEAETVAADTKPRTRKRFYGWNILAASALTNGFGGSLHWQGFTVFFIPISQSLGLTSAQTAMPFALSRAENGLLGPLTGWLIDRYGVRRLMFIGTLMTGIGYVWLAQTNTFLAFLLVYLFVISIGASSSFMQASTSALNTWFARRRGMAMGISGVAGSLLGLGGFPLLVTWLIAYSGWRDAYIGLGLLLVLGMFPLGWFFIRNQPEQYGLVPDGKAGPAGGAEGAGFVEEHWTLSEALHTKAFWVFAAGLASASMLNTGLTFHLFSVFKDNGLSPAVTASVFVPIAVTGALAQLGSGVLVDRIPVRYMLTLGLLLMAAVLVAVPKLASVEMALVLGVVIGLQGGIEMIVSSVVWPQYFGRRHMGSITGLASTIMAGASAFGPMPFGLARDLMGDYTAVLTWFALLPLVLAVAAFLFGQRPHKAEKG